MMINRLSAHTVKVQLSAEELRLFLPETVSTPESPQMLRLISFMLLRAETASEIPFSQLPVTVELLRTAEQGMIAYFTAQALPDTGHGRGQSGSARFAAVFSDRHTLQCCCGQLQKRSAGIISSMLFRYQQRYILALKLRKAQAGILHHILLEYGSPFRLSSLNRARLAEYGECIFQKDAVNEVLRQKE